MYVIFVFVASTNCIISTKEVWVKDTMEECGIKPNLHDDADFIHSQLGTDIDRQVVNVITLIYIALIEDSKLSVIARLLLTV